MGSSVKTWWWQAAIAGVALLIYFGVKTNVVESDRWIRGEVAPEFQLPVITDELAAVGVTLQDFRGQHLLVNFWASWCNVCREEAKHVQSLTEVSDLAIVGIASYDDPINVRTSERFKTATYQIANDPEGETARRYNVSGLPSSVLIDGEGHVVFRWSGPMTAERANEVRARLSRVAANSP